VTTNSALDAAPESVDDPDKQGKDSLGALRRGPPTP
jgi:hypothetical protein